MSERRERTPSLRVAGLSHRYGNASTLDGVDLVVERRRIVSVLGPSGSGKTTLLRCVAGFAEPVAGTIAVGGVEVCRNGRQRIPPERRRLGVVFQDYALFPHMSVATNVAFGLRDDADRDRRVAELLELIDMPSLGDRLPAELSGGQQQRVALARALAPRPELLLLDEPFANLDADRRASLIGELERVLAREGTSALLVTHNRAEALAVSDSVAVIVQTARGGRLQQQDVPETVYRCPANERIARITGEAQFLDGEARGDVADTPLGPVPLLEPRRGRVRVLLRPETLCWSDATNGEATARGVDGAAAVSTSPAGDARVLARRFAGGAHRLRCATPAGELTVTCPGDSTPPEGVRGRVIVRERCWAFRESGR